MSPKKKSAKTFCPEPGIYEDVPMSEYFTWDAASKSRLWGFRRSPAHARVMSEDTKATAFGRAAHVALLEPDEFKKRYASASQCVAHTGAGAQCQNQGSYPLAGGGSVCGTHIKKALKTDDSLKVAENVEILSEKDWAACGTIRERVKAKARASGLVSGPGRAELSLVWVDPELGIRCKGRIDRDSPTLAGGTIVDVKTTVDASDFAFERTIFNYGYHAQGAFYLDGMEALGEERRHCTILAVEKAAPFEISAFRLLPAALDAGRDLIRPILERYAWCKENDIWPGYPDRVREIALPDWAWKATDDIILEMEDRWNATI